MTPRSTPRRKKTRYLSLRRRLAAAASTAPMVASSIPDHTQLDLFPLRPEPAETALPNDPHDEHLSRFFPSDDAITLHSLLGTHFPSSPATASEGHISPSSSSANYSACSSSYGSGGAATAAAAGLARAALRGRERWWAEEEEESEAASGSGGLLSSATRRLSLKLDYDGILSAWPGELPLFVNGDGLQVVPDLHHTAAPLQYSTVFVDVGGGSAGGGGVWTVPDGGGAAAEEGEEDLEEAGQGREARVMRYREKRRHRLFSKRIRYEVRKLNAERRPRLKGRFVKRDDDV